MRIARAGRGKFKKQRREVCGGVSLRMFSNLRRENLRELAVDCVWRFDEHLAMSESPQDLLGKESGRESMPPLVV